MTKSRRAPLRQTPPARNLNLVYNFVDAGSHNNGNVVSITNNVYTPRSQSFTYDSLNRLATAQTNATHATDAVTCWGETYSYDPWGNLRKLGADTTNQSAYIGCTQESGFDFSAPGLIGTNNRIATTGYVYDAAGNLITSPGAGTVTFDAENHMVSAGGVNYLYDGDGRRVSKSNGTLYWYGSGSDPLMETNTSGGAINSYIFFGGKRVARSNSTGINWYVTDHLGTSRVFWTTAGMDVSDFYPFGGERVIQATAGGNNRYKFTGKERDTESGLDNFGARFDSSTLGRFMSPDPDNAGASDDDPQSWNAYSYALNNPLNVLDPDGRDTVYVVCGADRGSGCAKITKDQFEALMKSGNFLYDSKNKLIYAKNADGSQGALLAGYFSYDNRAEQANAFANDLFKSMALNYAFGAGELGIGRLFGLGGTAFRISAQSEASAGARAARGGIGPVLKGAAGVARAEAEAVAEGGEILGEEITIETSSGRARADFVY